MIRIGLSSQLAIRYSQIVGEIVNLEVDQIANQMGASRKEVVDGVLAHALNISRQHYENHEPDIPYIDSLCRIAYLYHEVPVNAFVIETIFSQDPNLRRHLETLRRNNNQLRLCTLGGGPGTDVLGLAKYIEKNPFASRIVLNPLLTDRVGDWQANWSVLFNQNQKRLETKYGQQSPQSPLVVEPGKFHAVDVEDLASVTGAPEIFDQDIYIVSYLLSHVFQDFDQPSPFSTELVQKAKVGTKFIFVDRNESRWLTAATKLATGAGLSATEAIEAESGSVSSDEDLTHLEQIYDELGARMTPRLRWKVFWMVGSKV